MADVCKTVQQDLNRIAAQNAPELMPEKTGLLDAITSPVNTRGVQQLQTDLKDGKYRQVKIEYVQPSTHDEVSDTPEGLCTQGETRSPLHDLVSVTRYKEIKRDFDEEEMRHFWKAPSEYRARIMATDMNALYRAINRDLAALYLAKVGNFIGGVAGGKDLNMIQQKATGEIRADLSGESTMMEDMQDLSIAGMPMVVGTGNLSEYATLQKLGVANDLGQDLGKLKNFMFFRDRDVDQISAPAANKNNMLVFAPGACQMVTFNKYKGEFAHRGDQIQKVTIVNPVKNIEFDWNLKYDDCAERYLSTIKLHYDYWVLPSDAFKPGDERAGVNYTFNYFANRVIETP